MIPQWKIRLAQQPHEALPTRIRVQVGSSFRDFGPVDGLDGSTRTAHEFHGGHVLPSQSGIVDGLDGSDGLDGHTGTDGTGQSNYCKRGMCAAPAVDGSSYCAQHVREVAA